MEEQTVHREKKRRRLAGWAKIVIAVALTLAASTGMWCLLLGRSGLAMVQTYLLARFAFVEADADLDKAVDLGLDAFVQGLGDRWSYYRTQEQYRELRARRATNYVGIGVTVTVKDREGPWPARPGERGLTTSRGRRAPRWSSPCCGRTAGRRR